VSLLFVGVIVVCRCHCGEVLMEHAGMQGPFGNFASADMMMEYIVPKGKLFSALI